MEVSLTPELEKFVNETVSSGRFKSPSDLVQASLRLLEAEDKWKEYARAKIEDGLEDVRQGKFVSQEEVEATLKKYIRKRA